MSSPDISLLLERLDRLEARVAALEGRTAPTAPSVRPATPPPPPPPATHPITAPATASADEEALTFALVAAAVAAYLDLDLDQVRIRVISPFDTAWAAEGRREITHGRNVR